MDSNKLLNKIVDLREKVGGTDFNENDRQSSADVIEKFLTTVDDIHIKGLNVTPGEKNSQTKIQISGVDINIRPDILLSNPRNNEIIGAIKLHFSKTYPLTKKGGEYVATAIRVHLEGQDTTKVDPKKCIVIDVPAGDVITAPKAFKRNMNDISAACEEIKSRWLME